MSHPNMQGQNHQYYMGVCQELANKAKKTGNSPVGSLLVYDDKIIGLGIESAKTTKDITDHAEILAIRDAISKGFLKDLQQSILYSTHEPCIMCSYLIRHHKIPLVVYGYAVDHIGGSTSEFNVLGAKNIPQWGNIPEVIGGILEKEK